MCSVESIGVHHNFSIYINIPLLYILYHSSLITLVYYCTTLQITAFTVYYLHTYYTIVHCTHHLYTNTYHCSSIHTTYHWSSLNVHSSLFMYMYTYCIHYSLHHCIHHRHLYTHHCLHPTVCTTVYIPQTVDNDKKGLCIYCRRPKTSTVYPKSHRKRGLGSQIVYTQTFNCSCPCKLETVKKEGNSNRPQTRVCG